MVSPHAKRQAVRHLVVEHDMSERHACQVVDMPRSTARYQPQGRCDDAEIVVAVRDFAYRFPQHGYRHITARMRREGNPEIARDPCCEGRCGMDIRAHRWAGACAQLCLCLRKFI